MSGATKGLEPDDPFQPTVARYAVESTLDADREMARCIVEEYALVAWPARRIRRLFDSPLYQGPHAILERNGAAFVDAVIADVFGPIAHGEERR